MLGLSRAQLKSAAQVDAKVYAAPAAPVAPPIEPRLAPPALHRCPLFCRPPVAAPLFCRPLLDVKSPLPVPLWVASLGRYADNWDFKSSGNEHLNRELSTESHPALVPTCLPCWSLTSLKIPFAQYNLLAERARVSAAADSCPSNNCKGGSGGSDDDDSGGAVSGGAIAGYVIGGLLLIGIVVRTRAAM